MRNKFLFMALFLYAAIGLANQTLYGPTAKTDQLWQIAILTRPNAQVSIQQMMREIYQANRTAFAANDMHKLKAGEMLTIPEITKISTITNDESLDVQSQQHKTTAVKLVGDQFHYLQQQFTKLGDVIIDFDQQYQMRLERDKERNLMLLSQLQMFRQQLNRMQARIYKINNNGAMTTQFKYLKNLKVDWRFILGALVLVLFLLMGAKLSSRKNALQDAYGDEYDFMGSEEGVPAKLDLAQAYFDMGEEKSAEEVLQEIMKIGNDEQRAKARELLKNNT